MEKTIMEKECAICGKFFSTTNKLRKYCDDCKDNQTNLIKRYNSTLKRSRKNCYIEPKPVEYTCEICSGKFKTLPKLLFKIPEDESCDGKKHIFCSKFHLDSYYRKVSTCLNCNKSLEGNLFYKPVDSRTQFCCPKCKKEYDRKEAVKNGRLKICKNCGKEFISDNKYFCCANCHNAAVKKGWKPPKRQKEDSQPVQKKEKIMTRKLVCIYCNKNFTIKGPISKLINIDPFSWYCSKECKNKDTKKPIRIKPQSDKQIKTTEQKEVVQICITCKTSYSDCERMKSNFRIIPKGAHYNGQGILISCPKFS